MKRTAFAPNNSLYIKRIKNSAKYNMPVQHYHDAHEIYLQLDGTRYAFFDNMLYTFKRGDLAVFKPFDIHCFESRESDYYERYGLNFNLEDLSPLLSGEEINILSEKLGTCAVHLSEEQLQILLGYFENADRLSKNKGFLSEKLLCASMLELCAYTAQCISGTPIQTDSAADVQVAAALKYINSHYMENITLDDAAAAASTSKFYFCRKFHATTGATVLEYLNNLRLTKVHSLLLDTDMNIGEIAEATGFSSALNLTRAFKKVYEKSPRDFRRSQKEKSKR